VIRDHKFSPEQVALAKKSVSDLFSSDPADRAVAAKRFRNSEIPSELILQRLKLAELQSEAFLFAEALLLGVPLIPVVLFMRERYPATYFYAVFIAHTLLVLALGGRFPRNSIELDAPRSRPCSLLLAADR
jgi:hypothetical protein